MGKSHMKTKSQRSPKRQAQGLNMRPKTEIKKIESLIRGERGCAPHNNNDPNCPTCRDSRNTENKEN